MGMHNVMNAMAESAVRGMTMAGSGGVNVPRFKHRQRVYADGRFTVVNDSIMQARHPESGARCI